MYFFDIIELVKANSGRYRSLSVFDNRLFCDTEDGADAIRAYLVIKNSLGKEYSLIRESMVDRII